MLNIFNSNTKTFKKNKLLPKTLKNIVVKNGFKIHFSWKINQKCLV